jgi:hypothetical protein
MFRVISCCSGCKRVASYYWRSVCDGRGVPTGSDMRNGTSRKGALPYPDTYQSCQYNCYDHHDHEDHDTLGCPPCQMSSEAALSLLPAPCLGLRLQLVAPLHLHRAHPTRTPTLPPALVVGLRLQWRRSVLPPRPKGIPRVQRGKQRQSCPLACPRVSPAQIEQNTLDTWRAGAACIFRHVVVGTTCVEAHASDVPAMGDAVV